MRKITFLKFLLVAACMLVGGNAWATTYIGSVNTVGQNRITNNNNGTFTTAGNAGNAYALAIADLSGIEYINGATSVTLDFDVNIPLGSRWLVGIGDKTIRGTTANGSSKSTYNTDGLIMRFGTSDGTYFRVNEGTNNSDAFGVNAHCTFTLDRANNKYSYTIKNGETTLFSASNVSTTVTSATIVEFYSWVNSSTVTISNVSYSFEYEASSYTYMVKAVDSDKNVLQTLGTGTTTETSCTIIYPYAIKKDGFWYTTSASTFGVEVSALSPNADITYTKDESIVAFYEGEATAGADVAYSNGGYGTVAAQNARDRGTNAGTLTPGVYKFVGRLVADGNTGRAITLREGANDPMASLAGNNTTKTATADFTIYRTTGSLYINGANSDVVKTNLSTSFDYVLIKRTGDVTEVEMAIFDCKCYDPSAAFATAIDAESFTTAAEVYAFNTSYHITNGTVTDGVRDITGIIRNAAIADITDWEGARTWSGEKYTGAPDNYYFDQWQATLDTYQMIYGLPAGNYTLKAATRGSAGASGSIYVYAAGQADTNAGINLDGNLGGELGQGWSWTTVNFTLTATSDVKIGFYTDASASGQWAGCDDWHLYKVESVSKTISDAGWATYCSPYALDFTNDIANLTDAYIVTGDNGTSLTLTSVKGGTVPANTGLVLKGEGACTIPVAASSSTNVTANKLVGVTSATELAAGIYVLLNGESGVGFYHTTNMFTVGANSAYLPADAFSTKAFFYDFNEDITSIEKVINAKEMMNGEFFDLSGRKVAKPTKGLYILNSKKVFIK